MRRFEIQMISRPRPTIVDDEVIDVKPKSSGPSGLLIGVGCLVVCLSLAWLWHAYPTPQPRPKLTAEQLSAEIKKCHNLGLSALTTNEPHYDQRNPVQVDCIPPTRRTW